MERPHRLSPGKVGRKNLMTKLKPQKISSASNIAKYSFLGILAIGFYLRIWQTTWGLPQVYEEAIPLRLAWQMWASVKSGLDLNPHFFTYPALTFYLQFVLQGITYAVSGLLGGKLDPAAFSSTPEVFVILARSFSVFCDCGTIVLVYLFARRLLGVHTAIAASGLTAINPLLVKEAHLINVDTPLTFLCVLTVYFLERLYENPHRKWYILAGLGVGLATGAKYNGAVLILVLFAVHCARYRSLKEIIRQPNFYLSIATAGGVFLLCNPFIVLNFRAFYHDVTEVRLHMEGGHLGLDPGQNAFEDYFFHSLPESLTWPVFLLAVGALIYLLVGMRNRRNVVLVSFPMLFLLMVLPLRMRADRYILPLIPFLVLLASIGSLSIWELVSYRLRSIRTASALRFTLAGLLAILMSFGSIAATLQYERSLDLPDTRTLAKRWIESHVPIGSALATGPFGIDLDKGAYAILDIPFNAGNTEVTIPYYKPIWYEDLDLVITSDYDYGRYKLEPKRFSEILAFYDSIKSRWQLVEEIVPDRNQQGPTFWLYHPISSHNDIDPVLLQDAAERSDSIRVVNFFGKLSLILSSKNELQKAEQLLEFLTQFDAANKEPHRELATVLYQMNDYNDALIEIEKYLKFEPNDPEALVLEGRCFIGLEKVKEAEQPLQRALELNPQFEEAYVELSRVYARLNDKAHLIATLRQYYESLPPNSDKARLIQQQIKSLGNL